MTNTHLVEPVAQHGLLRLDVTRVAPVLGHDEALGYDDARGLVRLGVLRVPGLGQRHVDDHRVVACCARCMRACDRLDW